MGSGSTKHYYPVTFVGQTNAPWTVNQTSSHIYFQPSPPSKANSKWPTDCQASLMPLSAPGSYSYSYICPDNSSENQLNNCAVNDEPHAPPYQLVCPLGDNLAAVNDFKAKLAASQKTQSFVGEKISGTSSALIIFLILLFLFLLLICLFIWARNRFI
jgi:hypothetical protein